MHVQIVKFKLNPDICRETFLGLTRQMIAWLKNKDGFIAYELYEGAECWSDKIAWKNEKLAQDGLNDFLAIQIAVQMIPLVENGYSSFFRETVASA